MNESYLPHMPNLIISDESMIIHVQYLDSDTGPTWGRVLKMSKDGSGATGNTAPRRRDDGFTMCDKLFRGNL